jgi:hypothetical protein
MFQEMEGMDFTNCDPQARFSFVTFSNPTNGKSAIGASHQPQALQFQICVCTKDGSTPCKYLLRESGYHHHIFFQPGTTTAIMPTVSVPNFTQRIALFPFLSHVIMFQQPQFQTDSTNRRLSSD